MLLEILTPEAKVFSGEVYGVQMPGQDGLFEVLDNHAPMVSALGKGTIKILTTKNAHPGSHETFAIDGGFAETLNNRVTVLAEGASTND
ncbi:MULTISPECIES: ATP synthase F1 subunit epsilon [Chitinophagaceae]